MSEDLTNEMQWGEKSPNVIQLNEMKLSVMTPRVNQMNGPLLSVNVCLDALTHSNSRCTDHSLL